MAWCMDCWTNNRAQVTATKLYDEDSLCDSCVVQRQKEDGDDIVASAIPTRPANSEQPTRWGSLFSELALLPINKTKKLHPDNGQDVNQFRDNLRSALSQNSKTQEFKWSLQLDGKVVRASKVGLWADAAAIANGSPTVKVTDKKTTTKERSIEVTAKTLPSRRDPKEKPTAQYDLALQSGGFVNLSFDGDLFALSEKDRAFVFGLLDRMHRYGDPGDKPIPQSSKVGEKLYSVLLPVSALEEVFQNVASDEEAAALYAAWWRDDPAVRIAENKGETLPPTK